MMCKQSDYKVSIEEIHHTQKLDAPSGTAVSLAKDIIENSEYHQWQLVDGNEVSETKNTIPITAKRIGDVKGTHIVTYESTIDTLSIKHEAHTRNGFALGAILAAEWLKGRKGIYTMKEVLGL